MTSLTKKQNFQLLFASLFLALIASVGAATFVEARACA
jgi:hypothetical protein